MTDPPHFAAPFSFNGAGVANVVEQDSVEEVAACVYNVVVCIEGQRIDEPDFGIPDPMFANAPVDITAIEDAIAQWEPRADLSLSEHGDAINAALRTVQIDVQVEENA